jgi:hypothetical protein
MSSYIMMSVVLLAVATTTICQGHCSNGIRCRKFMSFYVHAHNHDDNDHSGISLAFTLFPCIVLINVLGSMHGPCAGFAG